MCPNLVMKRALKLMERSDHQVVLRDVSLTSPVRPACPD